MDIVLGEDWDLLMQDGDIVFGDTTIQDVGSVLMLNMGDLKYCPQLGPGLIRFVKGKATKEEIEKQIALHLKIDGKEYKELKQYINTGK